MKKQIALLSTIGAAAFAISANAATVRWDLPSAYPPSNLHTQTLAKFVKEVSKLSGGELKITLHSNASLFSAPQIKRAVQGNQAQIGEILLTNYANENPIYALDGLPFVATSYDAAWKLYQAQKQALDNVLKAQGMKLLYTVAWPPQGIFANKTINSVADLKGLKWRAYSPVTARIAELVGAQPVTVQQSELAQAMATGVVDAFMTSGATGSDTKAYEYMKKFYNTQAWLPKNAVIVNIKDFDALNAKSKEALLQAAADAEKSGWALSREKNDWYLANLKKNGMEIIKPSAKLMAGLSKVGETMLTEWLKKAGPTGQKVIDAYRAGK